MKIKICIIGVKDSIELAQQVAEEFDNIIEFSFYSYLVVDDIIEYVKKFKDLDVVMFTGRFPYEYFKKNSILNIPFFSIAKSNESLTETIWNIRNAGLDYTKISIDRSPIPEVADKFRSLDIDLENIKMIGDSSEISLEEIYDFHKSNYDQGLSEVIVSSNYKVYQKLKSENYNVYRVLPSKFLLRESIKKAVGIASTEKLKSTQVAVQTIHVRDFKENKISKYNQLKLINQFDDILIDYTEELQGSYFKYGSNEYMIFSTRGFLSVADIEKKFGMLVERSDKIDISFSLGIGYGDSVKNSEKNSKVAIKHSKELDRSNCFIVDDDSTITGPIFGTNSKSINYNLLNTDKKIIEISDKTDVSVQYISKIEAIIIQRKNNQFDTEELADYLNLSQRSSLRIINKLVEGGFAKLIGKSNNGTKGRPKKVFMIEFR